MFYIQFFKRNPFLKRKKQKKILPGVKNAFFGQNWPKKWCLCTFCAHFCIILAECNVAQVVGHGRQVYDMISDTLEFKNGQKMSKNGQKPPKWPKTVRKWWKMQFLFLMLTFFLFRRHFICCSLKRSKIAQNGQKWPKTAQNGIFDSCAKWCWPNMFGYL